MMIALFITKEAVCMLMQGLWFVKTTSAHHSDYRNKVDCREKLKEVEDYFNAAVTGAGRNRKRLFLLIHKCHLFRANADVNISAS